MKSLLIAFLAATALPAAARTLCTTRALNDYQMHGPAPAIDYCLTGTVVQVSSNITPRCRGIFILEDTFGRSHIFNAGTPLPVPGDIVIARGNLSVEDNLEPRLYGTGTVRIGQGQADQPSEVRLTELNETRWDLHLVRTQGEVADVVHDEVDANVDFLILSGGGATLPVAVSRTEIASDTLLGAVVEVTGLYRRTVSGDRKFSGPFIDCSRRTDLKMLRAPPVEKFEEPSIAPIHYISPRTVAEMGRRTAFGTVLATWQGNRFMLRTDDGRIFRARVRFGRSLPPVGARITAAGRLETDLFTLALADAEWRADGHVERNAETPQNLSIGNLFLTENGRLRVEAHFYGQLIRLKGVVRTSPDVKGPRNRIFLEASNRTLPVDLSVCPEQADELPIGSTVEATGICLVEGTAWSPLTIFPRIDDIALIVRNADDLRLLARPPWWTPTRIIVLFLALLIIIIAVIVWNRLLSRLAERRGQALCDERLGRLKADVRTTERTNLAVELHDTLSQSLMSISYQLATFKCLRQQDPANAERLLESADQLLKSCRTDLKLCLWDLRNNTLGEANFETAVRKTLEQVAGDAELTIRFNLQRDALLDTTAHTILRILRELVSNAVQHGHAAHVRVACAFDTGKFSFSVRDDGYGFDTSCPPDPSNGHFGLTGIRERLQKFGGSLTLTSAPKTGTTAICQMSLTPLDEDNQ